MKLTIVRTDRIEKRHGVTCRVWEGMTPDDVKYKVYVRGIAAVEGVPEVFFDESCPVTEPSGAAAATAYCVADSRAWFEAPIANLDLPPGDILDLQSVGLGTVGGLATVIGRNDLFLHLDDPGTRERVERAYLAFVARRKQARYDLDLSEAVRDAERRRARGDGPCLDPNL